MTLVRTYKFRLLPSKGQHKRLREALDQTRELYNAALQERTDAYRKTGRTIGYFNQSASLKQLRQDEEFSQFAHAMQRWPLKQLDLAFHAFFRRCKSGENPGYPRFKSRDHLKTFGFLDDSGWGVDGQHLRMKGIGRVRLHLHRPVPSRPKVCAIKKDSKGWCALLVCEVDAEPLEATGRSVGLDLGITSLIAASDGTLIPGYRAARRAQAGLRRRSRALARCKRGSSNRRKAKARLAALHEHTANSRRTHFHQIAARLVRENDVIAIENLNVKGLAVGMLSRDVHDAGWTIFTNLLIEKAEKAGRSIVKVDPKYTSQICPDCGQVKAKTLAQRIHECDCGCVLDRDVAAARVILSRAVSGPVGLNVGSH